ncbi:MAG: MFS transporter [Gemmatimonadota bacterium]|nr:MFS transporter [Gemmatimonadota bacterium]MDH3422755.1 MFS transporter [Gemmatimonadota bacterium]
MNKKQVGAWALFDFANSVFPAVIVSVVFQIYFIEVVVGNEAGEGDAWWGRAVSMSALIVALSAPVLGAIADRAGVRKRFMGFYVAMCVTAVALFTTLGPGLVVYAFVLFLLANVGFESSLVFYNAYLPDIAPSGDQGRVSGLGFGIGYLGSALGLVLALPFATTTIQLVWVMVALFFIVFSIPSFVYLPSDQAGEMSVAQAARWGVTSFRSLWEEVLRERELRRFLLAFFFYIDGVLTAIYMSSTLASTTFGFEQNELIYLYLAIQMAALAGAFALARPTDTLGPKKVVTGVLMLWIAVALGIFFVESKAAFTALGMVAGFGLGSVQAASRAFMARLIPDGRESEMFGFYALCGKSSSVIGPLVFGQVALVTGGNQKLAVMSISILFVIGALLLQRVNDTKGAPAT